MLPVLFKLEFATQTMKLIYLAIALGLTVYGAWAGWRGAESRASAPWRAVPFAAAAALVACLAAVWAFPPMSAGLASATRIAVYVLSGILVVSGALYGRSIARKGEETGEMIKAGAIGAALGFAAIKFGLGGQLGRGFGAPLHSYGLMIATAFIVALWVASREALRAYPETIKVSGKMVPAGPVMRDHMLDLGFYILVSAIIGSRVLFIIVNWSDYQRDLSQVFSLSGGLVFYGGFLGAFLTSIWYCRKHKIDFLRLADMAIPSVALGHMFGRLGCLAAGCCWGGIAKAGSAIGIRFPSAKHLPFGGFGTDSLAFQDQAKDPRWVDALGHIHQHAVEGAQQISAYAQSTGFSMPVYPTQIMESGGELLLFLGLIALRRFKRFNGQILATWLVGYSILRTTIELFRGDLARGYLFRYPEVDPVILSTSQLISLGIFLTGVAIYLVYGRRAKTAPSPVELA